MQNLEHLLGCHLLPIFFVVTQNGNLSLADSHFEFVHPPFPGRGQLHVDIRVTKTVIPFDGGDIKKKDQLAHFQESSCHESRSIRKKNTFADKSLEWRKGRARSSDCTGPPLGCRRYEYHQNTAMKRKISSFNDEAEILG